MNDIQIIESIPSNFLILEKKLGNEYKSVDGGKNIFIIQEKFDKIAFTNSINSRKQFFYRDDIETSDTLSIVLKNLKNSRILQRYSTLTEPLSHLVLFQNNNINFYLYHTIPNLFLDTIELFDNTTKDVKTFKYNEDHTVKATTSFRYNTLDFFIKDNDLKSVIIDDNEYRIPTITNKFYEHLSSVIIGKITIGEPLYIKSFLFNDKTIIDVFQEKKYNIIDATQKFLICRRNFKFREPIFSYSTLLDQKQNELNEKSLQESNDDLSSFILNKQHINNILKITSKWPLYTLYMKYIRYLNGENNFFSKYTYEETKELFRANKSITFKKNVARKRRINLKQKANLFYNSIITDDIQFNFSALELITQGTKYSHIPEYIIQGYLENINSKKIKSVDDKVFKFASDMTGILTHNINNINSQVMTYISLLSGTINQDTFINSEQKKEALSSGKDNIQIMKQSRGTLLTDTISLVGSTKKTDRNFILNSNSNAHIIISEKINIKNLVNKMILVNDNFLIGITYLHFKQKINIKNILNNFSKSINELFQKPRIGQNISNAKIPNSLQKIFLLKNGVKNVLSDVTILNTNFKLHKKLTENIKNIEGKFNIFQNTGCKALDCNNINGEQSSSQTPDQTQSETPDQTSSSQTSNQTPDGNTDILPDGNTDIPPDIVPEIPQIPEAIIVDPDDVQNIGEAVEVEGVDQDRLLLTKVEFGDFKMYLYRYGTHSSQFIFRHHGYPRNDQAAYRVSIVLNNRVFPGVLPDPFTMRMYNTKMENLAQQGSFPPAYAIGEIHRTNVFAITANSRIFAEELNNAISSPNYNSKNRIRGLRTIEELVKIDGESIVKNVDPQMTKFIIENNVRTNYLSYRDFDSIWTYKPITIYREGLELSRIIIDSQGQTLAYNEQNIGFTNYFNELIERYGDDYLSKLPTNPFLDRFVDEIIQNTYYAFKESNYSIYDKQWTRYMYWMGDPTILDNVNKFLTEANKFERIIYCTEIDNNNLLARIDLEFEEVTTSTSIYYFETESGKQLIAEKVGNITVQDFNPNKLYNIIETIENIQESTRIPRGQNRNIGFTMLRETKNNLYDNMRRRFYPDNSDTISTHTILQYAENITITDRIRKIQNIITTNNLSITEKYVLNLNGFYNFSTDTLNTSGLINASDDIIEMLSNDLSSVYFNLTNRDGNFTGLQYRIEDPIVQLKKEVYRFIRPSAGTKHEARTLFQEYPEELLDQFIELNAELQEVFNKIENIVKVKLNDRYIYIDKNLKTFVGDFKQTGAKNILNHIEFEEVGDVFNITPDYNIVGPDGEIYHFDASYNNIGNDFNQTFPNIEIADDNIVYISRSMNVNTGFQFNIKEETGFVFNQNQERTPMNNFPDDFERNTFETENNIITEINFKEGYSRPALSKISYIFNKTMQEDGDFRGKPQIEVIIENQNENGSYQQRAYFEGNEQIKFNLKDVQLNYSGLIQNSRFDKASSKYSSINTLNEIKNSYLSADNITHVKIDKNFFQNYDMRVEKENIISLVNSSFDYDNNQLTLSDVENVDNIDIDIEDDIDADDIRIDIEDTIDADNINIEMEEPNDILELKKKMYFNELEIRKLNLSLLNELYTEYFKLSERSVKFNNDIKDLYFIGNLDQQELRTQYIRSPTKVRNLYFNNYRIIFKEDVNYRTSEKVELYKNYDKNKNIFELEITKKLIAQSATYGEDISKLSSFNQILGEQVFQNTGIIWNGSQKYHNILNISVCEFTPILIDNDGNVIYQQHFFKVDLDKELKDKNMKKRYVILDNEGSYFEIYKAKDIENINNIWKILPSEIMQNRDKLFLEQLKDKRFVISDNIFIDEFTEQNSNINSETQTEKLEKHRSVWNQMYDNSITNSISEINIPIPNLEHINEYIDSFSNDKNRKNTFESIKKSLLNDKYSEDEVKLIIFGIDDEDVDMKPNIRKKQVTMANSFFNWFVRKEQLKVSTGRNKIKEIQNEFSKKSLSEWKETNEYNNLQVNRRNKENIFKRYVEADNYNLVKDIFDELEYENIENFSESQIRLIDFFIKRNTVSYNIERSNRKRRLHNETIEVQQQILAAYKNQIYSTDSSVHDSLKQNKFARLEELEDMITKEVDFEVIMSKFDTISKNFNLQAANFAEQKLNNIYVIDLHLQMFREFQDLKNSLGPRFKNMNYHEFVGELRNKIRVPSTLEGITDTEILQSGFSLSKASDGFRVHDDYRFKKLESYLETPYDLDEILEAAEFERKYEQYKGVLLNIVSDLNLENSLDEFNKYQTDVPELERVIENNLPDSQDLNTTVINKIKESDKFYTVDRNNIASNQYVMKENSLKDIIREDYDALRNGQSTIKRNREKYGNLIDDMKVKSNSRLVDICIFEQLDIDLKEVSETFNQKQGDDLSKEVMEKKRVNVFIESKFQQYNAYLPSRGTEKRLLKSLYKKFQKDPSVDNANNILAEIDKLEMRKDELDMEYRVGLAKKQVIYNKNDNILATNIENKLKGIITNEKRRKKFINQFFAVLSTEENIDNSKIKNIAVMVFKKVDSTVIDSFDLEDIKKISKNNINKFSNYRDEINKLKIYEKQIEETNSMRNYYQSIKFTTIDEAEKEIDNYQNILNQEMEELEISETVKNHNTNFYTTLDIDDTFFKQNIQTELYTTTVESPTGEFRVFTKEEMGTISYTQWLNLKDTQQTITNNHGYIDPPVVESPLRWREYYNKQSSQWKKVLNEDFISLDLFDWSESSTGEITASYNPKKRPELIMSKARELLKQNKIKKLDGYMKSNRKYLDNSTIQKNLPVGQPIKINGVYFVKIQGNNVIRNNPDFQNDTNQFLVKITEQQLRQTQQNSVKLNYNTLKVDLERRFNIKLDDKIIEHMRTLNQLPEKLTIFNIYQIHMIVYNIKKAINSPDSTRERQALRGILETREEYLDKGIEKINTIIDELQDIQSQGTEIENSSVIEDTFAQKNLNIEGEFRNALIENIQEFLEDNFAARLTSSKYVRDKARFIEYKCKPELLPILQKEYDSLKNKIVSDINEVDINVVNNSSIIRNFENTSVKLKTQRNIFNMSRSNLRKTMTTVLDDYANTYYPNNPEVKEFFKKDMWFQPKDSTKQSILNDWNNFKTYNIAGINADAPEPPLPQDYASNSMSFFEQAYTQSSVYFDIASTYMNTPLGKALTVIGTLGLGALGVFGIIQMTKEDKCNVLLYDRETGERKKPDTDCNALNIEEMTNFCDRLSNNADGIQYFYSIKIGDKYKRRYEDEGEILAQDPEKKCTADGASNIKPLLKKTDFCHQSCSEYTIDEIENEPITEQTCIEKYNIPQGNHKLENIIRLTGKSLNELTNECSLETLLSKYVFGITTDVESIEDKKVF